MSDLNVTLDKCLEICAKTLGGQWSSVKTTGVTFREIEYELVLKPTLAICNYVVSST